MKFVTMKKPLVHSVYNGYDIAIPAGTKHVQIAFRQSHLVRNVDTGKVYPMDFNANLDSDEVRCNVYRIRGSRKLIHA